MGQRELDDEVWHVSVVHPLVAEACEEKRGENGRCARATARLCVHAVFLGMLPCNRDTRLVVINPASCFVNAANETLSATMDR